MSQEREFAFEVPLDSDGFVRRECPTCEREFKRFNSEEGQAAAPPEAGYFCPYCGVQAPANAWFTKAQIAVADSLLEREVIAPEMKKFEKSLKDMERKSGGFIKVDVSKQRPEPPPQPLTEIDDMVRVDFPCHPAEPVKVMESWDKEVRCLICGTPVATG